MPTFQEIMNAAVNADKAGDENAARMLVQEAQRMRSMEAPPVADQPGPAAPPRADSEAYYGKGPTEVDRFGDTIERTTRESREAVGQFASGAMDPNKNILQRAGNAAMVPVAALGVGISGTAGLVGEVAGGSPTNEQKLANDLMAMSQVAVPELAGGSSVISSINRGAKAASQLEKAPTPTQTAARAADDLGITPSLAMGGKTPAMVAAGMEKVPGSGKAIADDAARAVAEIEGAFQKINTGIGTARTSDRAGDALQNSLNSFVQRTKETSSRLYDAVAKKIPAETQIETPETVANIREALKAFESNPEVAKILGLDKWAGIADSLENGLSWQAASALRSQIGESIGKLTGPLSNMSGGRLKQAYASLTDDLGRAAESAGAGKEWATANKYYKARADRLTKQLDKLIKADNPERAFEMLVSSAKGDRATSDLNRLRSVRASMKEQEWNDLSASLLERLGKAKAGAQGADGDTFSPATFLTEWNKLSKEGRSLLVPKSAREELNKLTQVIEASKNANLERNFSNTGTPIGWLATIFGTSIDMGTTAAALGGSYLGSKALTNPMFLRAMNKAARGDMKQIKAMAGGKGPFAQDARTILRLSAADIAAGERNAANQGSAPLRAVSNP